MLDWTLVEAKIWKEVINLKRDKIHKNALFAIKYKLIYLNFVAIYK